MAPVTLSPNQSHARSLLRPFRCPGCWAGLWCLGIATVVLFSLLPPDDLPSIAAGSDKIQHVLGYALLAAGAVQLFARRRWQLLAGFALVLLGLWLEVLQDRTGVGRAMDPLDALANTLGVLIGLASMLTPLRDLLLRLDSKRSG